jgi:O-antigen/teichoic acid export membrane protein
LAILLLGETVGLWYLENKMVISEGRMTAARWVYHSSLASAMITITQTPYNASIMSHEKMNTYAYIDIFNTCLKLAIVYVLFIGNIDKLILYAILTLCVTIITSMVYRIYCIRNFEECKYSFSLNKEIFKPLFSFTGWNLYAEAGLQVSSQGIQIVLNLFFSTVINAAYSIANSVVNIFFQFATNLTQASNPQIIKYYVQGNIKEMQNLVENTTRFSFLFFFTICLPIFLEVDFVTGLWLDKVPEYTNIFIQLNMVMMLIAIWAFYTITTVIRATGKIVIYSIMTGTLRFITPVITYLIFRFTNAHVSVPILISIVVVVVILVGDFLIIKKYIHVFSVKSYIKRVILNDIYVSLIGSLLPVFIWYSLPEGWLRLMLVTLSSLLCMAFAIYFFALSSKMRKKIRLKTISLIEKQLR